MRVITLTLLTALYLSGPTAPSYARIPPCTSKYVVETVKVSWYGKPFHGRIMANGKRYNMYDKTTVAHKTLPFGTKVRFRNPRSNAVLVATVRDRGPYIVGRTFDLSKAGAEHLQTKGSGVVSLETCIVK